MDVVGELKRKMGEICSEIEELRSRIAVLEEQKSAFTVVIGTYDPDFSAEASTTLVKRRTSNPSDSTTSTVTQLLKGRNNRHIVLDLLRRHDRLMSSVDLADAFAHDERLPPDQGRQTALASRFAGTLSGLEKQGMVRKVETDGRRMLWEIDR